MPTFSQKSFAAGELSPALQSRTDVAKYAIAARTLRNVCVRKDGGAFNRAGTKFVCEVKDSSKATRLLPFAAATDSKRRIIELGDQYARSVKDGVQVRVAAEAISGATQANPCVITSTGHSVTNGNYVYVTGVLGMTQINNRTFLAANVTANTFEIQSLSGSNINSTGYSAYVSGGTVARILGSTHAYVEADLFDITYAPFEDRLTLAHTGYPVREAQFASSLAIDPIDFDPQIAAITVVSNTGAAGAASFWVVTSVASDTNEESLPSGATSSSATPSSGAPITINWNGVGSPGAFRVYRRANGIYGLIGETDSSVTSFIDNGITPDFDQNPPEDSTPFGSASNYPGAVVFSQGRRIFGRTLNDPGLIWGSKSGLPYNFNLHSPIQEDDPIKVRLREAGNIKHLIEIGKLVALTENGEWAVIGSDTALLTPLSGVNPKKQSSNGISDLRPLLVNSEVLYVTPQGEAVRSLEFDLNADGFGGPEVSAYASHLLEGHQLIDWAYQRTPHPIVWVVRDDGALLGLTYVKEQDIIAWHKHDTDGEVESVAVLAESGADAVYLIVKRTIDGQTKRYIERMHNRFEQDVIDQVLMDCSHTLDGRNTGVTTLTLSEYSGGGWLYTSTINVTASASTFATTDVGRGVHVNYTDDEGEERTLRVLITEYVSATVVRGTPHQTVDENIRSVATTDWALATKIITGLWHLEGKAVSVFADGFVVASPNNASYTTQTVAIGSITLDRPYAVVHVGLPYISDIETLDIDTISGRDMVDDKKHVSKVTLQVEKSRGIWTGAKPPTDDEDDPLEKLQEARVRDNEGYDSAVDLMTGKLTVRIEPQWNSNGRVFIRQVDPVPMQILAIHPKVTTGGG
jgi:Ubiquitin-activating enzyme E1 FCCH domain